VTCLAIVVCTFLAAGPTVAIVQIARDFGGGPTANLAVLVPKVSFFFTTPALMAGTGNLLWQPLIKKYGRRPIYIISSIGQLITAVWSGLSTSYASELVARILLGFFSGTLECLIPAIVTDVFFLHERGTVMAYVRQSAVCNLYLTSTAEYTTSQLSRALLSALSSAVQSLAITHGGPFTGQALV
jgi:MFS family permease